MITVLLWSSLTMIFIWRLRIILTNIGHHALRASHSNWFHFPSINIRPFKQLAIWSLELWLISTFYGLFGISIVAHLTAAICGFGLMLMMRERHVPIFEGIQVLSIPRNQKEQTYAT